MRRATRILGWAFGSLAALVLMGWVLGLEDLDYRPYFTAPYYSNTVARLRAVTNASIVRTGPLWAGFGRAPLTPQVGTPIDDPSHGKFRTLPLAGYGQRQGRPAEGVHDALWAKAVALRVDDRTVLLLGADALIIPPEVAEAAARQLAHDAGLSRSQLYFGATHTHGSLGGWGEGRVAEAFAGKFQPGVRIWFAGQLAAAGLAAVADLAPAAFGQTSFAAPEFIRNRLVGERGRVDDEFRFAVLRQDRGPMALIGVYGAHATVGSGQVMRFHGDYPGAWQRHVEEATGGLALFLAGGVGSHSPRAGADGLDGAERMGRALAEAVVARLPQVARTHVVPFGFVTLEVDLPELHVRVMDGRRLEPALARRLLPVRPVTLLQGLRLGDSIWLSTPCDFSGELALDLKAFACPLGLAAVVTSFNGDYIGYVIPARYYHLSGYEPRTMSFFGPEVPGYFSELLQGLALDLAHSAP